MSEYQYYEFLAVDKPLSPKQIEAVRAYSTRAEITSTRFVNEYHWGDFKGNPKEFLKRFFDLFVYVANWGTHQFAFRVPIGSIDLDAVKPYAGDAALSITPMGDLLLVDFESQTDPEWEEGGDAWMGSLAPVREELLDGDFRCLYIAWLAAVEMGECDDEDPEPPLPAGLGELSVAQRTLAEFLRVEQDLLTVAAKASPARCVREDGLAEWIAALPESEKNDLLTRMCDGRDPHAIVTLRRRFQASRAKQESVGAQPPRTVGELLAAAHELSEKRRKAEAEQRARKKAKEEAKTAKARAEHLARIAARQPAAWNEVDTLIATKQQKNYDQAIGLLIDLRDVAQQSGEGTTYNHRVADLFTLHAKKPSLIRRMVDAGLKVP